MESNLAKVSETSVLVKTLDQQFKAIDEATVKTIEYPDDRMFDLPAIKKERRISFLPSDAIKNSKWRRESMKMKKLIDEARKSVLTDTDPPIKIQEASSVMLSSLQKPKKLLEYASELELIKEKSDKIGFADRNFNEKSQITLTTVQRGIQARREENSKFHQMIQSLNKKTFLAKTSHRRIGEISKQRTQESTYAQSTNKAENESTIFSVHNRSNIGASYSLLRLPPTLL